MPIAARRTVRPLIAGIALILPAILWATDAPKHAELRLSAPGLAQGFTQANVLNIAGCTGGNQSPALHWSGAPAGTRSFVVTLYDPDDHDSPSGWWHWVVYDVPGAAAGFPANVGVEKSHALPLGAKQGRSDLGNQAYHGPCPDRGDKPHRYTFTVYALDVATLDVPEGASGAMVVETAHDHIIGVGKLVVPHGR